MALSKKNLETLLNALQLTDAAQARQIAMEANRQYKHRARIEAAHKAREVRIGQRVQLTAIRPQYLVGEIGVVEEFRNTKFLVKLDRGPVGKFRSGKIVLSPLMFEILPESSESDGS